VATRLITVVCGAMVIVSCAQDPQEAARRYAARGDRFAQEGRHDAALIEYRNAVRAWPAWSEAHQKLGDSLERLGRTAEAYRAYATGSRIVDGQPLPHSEEDLRAFVGRHPESVAARVALSNVLLARREVSEAEDELVRSIALEPSNELANRALAALYLASGRADEAETPLQVAAAQEPQRYRSRLALADFLMTNGRYDEARPLLERAGEEGHLARAVKLRLAAIDYDEGAVDAAHRAVSELLATDATAEDWTLQAQFLFREGKLTEALESARRALALDPKLAAAQNLTEAIRRQQLWP
jgi:tetratricopeptide (TPR) repeat protein